ncbi:MAG: DUF1972 domain-containing protein [Terracidiphilus sp.]
METFQFEAEKLIAPPLRTVRILGTHGVPANYGGFETAAENVALILRDHGWHVVVYCQVDGTGPVREDTWNGITRVLIPVDLPGWLGTSKFDWLSIAHACKYRDLCLTFGYNTGIFNFRQRLLGIPNVVNMDGIEWSRARWGPVRQAILYINERFSMLFASHLIADHPEIQKYLTNRIPRRPNEMIAYGADPVTNPDRSAIESLGLEAGGYMTLIARPIPENSISEIVSGFSARERGHKLVVLGAYQPDTDAYHRLVRECASAEVIFAGPIYDKRIVQAIRYFGVAYLHGHTVGGTNPSLVEAMAAGNAIIARDNLYNRWVAGEGALYFQTSSEVDQLVSSLLENPALRDSLGSSAKSRYDAEFTWERIVGQYEELLQRYLPASR